MPLYPIDECPDVYADACICDEQRSLIFLSIWGRDTAIQEFLARLTLGRADGGLEHFHVVDGGRSIPVFPDVDRLEKRTSRQLRGTLFGSLIHLWLFDSRCVTPDRVNHGAYALLPKGEKPLESLWPLVIDTCALPLLLHWQQPVMALLQELSMLKQLPGALGKLTGWELQLDIDTLQQHLGRLIRSGHLKTA